MGFPICPSAASPFQYLKQGTPNRSIPVRSFFTRLSCVQTSIPSWLRPSSRMSSKALTRLATSWSIIGLLLMPSPHWGSSHSVDLQDLPLYLLLWFKICYFSRVVQEKPSLANCWLQTDATLWYIRCHTRWLSPAVRYLTHNYCELTLADFCVPWHIGAS